MFSSILKFCNKAKNFPYFFLTPLPYAMGNASEQILIASSVAKLNNKKLIIIYTNFLSNILKYKICNKYLFDGLIFDKQVFFINDIIKNFVRVFLEIEFFFIRSFIVFNDFTFKIDISEEKRFLNVGIEEIYSQEKYNKLEIEALKYKSIKKFYINYNLIDLQKRIEKECNFKLKRYELDKGRKFVCLHVRDNKFRKDKGKKDYRNSNINNYIESIIYLLKKNYVVVRIGDKPLNKIKFSNNNFLDYPNLDIKSSKMDLHLIKNCSFYIGTQSGPMDTAYIFKKPVLLTNMCEIFASLPRKKEDRGIFKKILTKKNKFLSIKDFINLPYKYHNPEVDIKDLRFVENSPEELLISVKEFIENLHVKNKVSKLQRNFNIHLSKRFEKFFYENDNKVSLKKQTDAIKMIRMFKASEGFFLNHYLKKNFV